MTTSSHNYIALRGGEVDDMEFVKEFGVPKEYAYTKKLNDWMMDYQQTKNEQHYMSEGHLEPEAKAMAREKRMEAEADIEKLYELNNL